MSAVETPAGAAPNTAVDWHSINWKKVYRTVRRLQARLSSRCRFSIIFFTPDLGPRLNAWEG
jgi:hypothetical protein